MRCRTGALTQALPENVAVVEAFGEPQDVTLLAEEAAALGRVVDKRRREFGTVRVCARRALADLGFPPTPILPGELGAPRWPPGVVGSMTHCAGYQAAAVAHVTEVRTVGIDAEPHAPLPDGVLDLIAVREELAQLRRLTRIAPDIHWDRMLFSIKESVYKAWFPLARCWLGFDDAVVSIDLDGTFTARILVPGLDLDGSPRTEFSGRWVVRDELVITAIAVAVG